MTPWHEIEPKLRPWQPAAVDAMLRSIHATRTALDASDMGTGKTYVACAVAKMLRIPFLVVGPKISASSWHRAAEHFDDSISTISYELLRTGNTPFGTWSNPRPDNLLPNFVCECCQIQFDDPATAPPCYVHPRGIHCVATRKPDWNYGQFRYAPQIGGIIFDEVHACSSQSSLNAEMLIAAKRDNKIVMALSATAAHSPLQLRALGYVIGLHTLVPRRGMGWYDWLRLHGCGKLPNMPGLRWVVGEDKQAKIMDKLNSEIFPAHGARIRKADIPNFPTVTITAEEYNLDESDAIDEAYAYAIERVDERSKLDVAPDSAITKRLRARQRIEILKVPLAVELAYDGIRKGCGVAIFCSFSDTIDLLAKQLHTDCVIDGRAHNNKPGLRDARVAQFQRNESRVILLNSRAGGINIGLQDLSGKYPRLGLVFPDDSAVTMLQVFGRLPRDGSKSHSIYKILFAAHTCEGGIAKRLRSRCANLSILNDGALTDADLRPNIFNLTNAA